MTMAATPAVRSPLRTTFVLSGDAEQLARVLTFLRGQLLLAGAHLVLPERLFRTEHGSLPCGASSFSHTADIRAAIEAHDPDVVFLFSAYLFVFERLLPTTEVEVLLDYLRRRRRPIVTSDPFLGLGPSLTLGDVDTAMLAPTEPGIAGTLVRLGFRSRGRAARLLECPSLDDVVHLHWGSVPQVEDGVRRLAFFNPCPADEPEHRARPTAGPAERTNGHWLFVLADEDVGVQRALVGLREFVERLLGMLRSTIDAGARPSLVGPSALTSMIGGALGTTIDIPAASAVVDIDRRVRDAEYVFTWNLFSAPYARRMEIGRPVFAFDQGWLARSVRSWHARAQACVFGDWAPPILDQRRLFSPQVLAHVSREHEGRVRAAVARWQTCPTPDQVVDVLR